MRGVYRHAFLVSAKAGGVNLKLEYLPAGQIVTTHGIRGELKILPWSDGPEFLRSFRRVRIDGKAYSVESCRVQKSCNLLKLCGVDTVEQAQLLRGKTVEIFRADAPKDTVFAAELVGMQVVEAGLILGKITQVLDYPGNKVYVVQGEHTYLIPAVREFVLSTDLEEDRMEVRTIEGMISDED